MVFGLSASPLTLTGTRSRVLAIRRTWLGIGRTSDRPSPMPLMLPLATVSFLLVAVALLTVYTGEQYPLRPETVGHLEACSPASPAARGAAPTGAIAGPADGPAAPQVTTLTHLSGRPMSHLSQPMESYG